MTTVQPKNERCPVCNVEISWNQTSTPNVFKGKCPNCSMGFTFMNGMIVSDSKFSKK